TDQSAAKDAAISTTYAAIRNLRCGRPRYTRRSNNPTPGTRNRQGSQDHRAGINTDAAAAIARHRRLTRAKPATQVSQNPMETTKPTTVRLRPKMTCGENRTPRRFFEKIASFWCTVK